MPFFKMAEWLQNKQGIKVFNEGTNRGVFIFRHEGTYRGHKYSGKIGVAPFYETSDGKIWWEERSYNVTMEGKRKRRWAFDLLRIPNETVPKFIAALQEMIGIKVEEPVKPIAIKREKEMKEAVEKVRVKVEDDKFGKEVDKYVPK